MWDDEMPAMDRTATPRNPKLPPYDGGQDPALWLDQYNACFIANHTPDDQRGPWMITALRGEACRYFFQECKAADTTPTYIVDRLKARFRSHIYLFELDAKLNALKMRAGRFQEFCEAFTALALQC